MREVWETDPSKWTTSKHFGLGILSIQIHNRRWHNNFLYAPLLIAHNTTSYNWQTHDPLSDLEGTVTKNYLICEITYDMLLAQI